MALRALETVASRVERVLVHRTDVLPGDEGAFLGETEALLGDERVLLRRTDELRGDEGVFLGDL
jgi:hypothetical protein